MHHNHLHTQNLVTLAPQVEILDLPSAKLHLRVDFDDDDDLISDLIVTARMMVENCVRRTICPCDYLLTLSSFPGAYGFGFGYQGYGNGLDWHHHYKIVLPNPPLLLVNGISYYDLNTNPQVLPPSSYQVSLTSGNTVLPGCVIPTPGTCWPATAPRLDAVAISYSAGYNPVPACARTAVKLLIGHLYRNREATSPEGLRELPIGVKHVLAPLLWGSYT